MCHLTRECDIVIKGSITSGILYPGAVAERVQIGQESPMNAISTKQPFAELNLRGEKRTEFRGNKTNHRGDMLLHASKTDKLDQREFAERNGIDFGGLPKGAVAGVFRIAECRAETGREDGRERTCTTGTSSTFAVS